MVKKVTFDRLFGFCLKRYQIVIVCRSAPGLFGYGFRLVFGAYALTSFCKRFVYDLLAGCMILCRSFVDPL
jgi:hypothetical protein